jgi:hypothetical protein
MAFAMFAPRLRKALGGSSRIRTEGQWIKKSGSDAETVATADTSRESPTDGSPSSPVVVGRGQSVGNQPVVDPVEAALADALTRAAAAQQWTTIEVLSRELQARREARAGVVVLDSARKRRGRPQ